MADANLDDGFYGTNLYGAILFKADLSGANLTRADLSGADLTRANLFGVRLPDLSQNQVTLLVADRRPTRRRA